MYKVFYSILIIIWLLDVSNFPQMEFLDTTYPVNGILWFLIWCILPSPDENKKE